MPRLAPVNKIIPFSLVDGPGSRTSIFLQGCNIACVYCHNPETQRACIGCGACVSTCPVGALSLEDGEVLWNKAVCVGCDTCLRTCPNRSTPKIERMSAREVFEQIKGYMPFIRGITVSGGECMLWPEWLCELFTLARAQGLGTLIDSNGTFPFAAQPELMAVTCGVMLDIKAWDNDVAQKLTGKTTEAAKENLAWLADTGKLEEVRVVVVDGWVDAEACITGIAQTLGPRTKDTRLKLIRFRNFGVLGELASAPSPSDEKMASLEAFAREAGFEKLVLT